MAGAFPPCGLYRTLAPIGPIAEGRLVYFHDHGDPGPGIYAPESWSHNRANFSKRGTTIGEEEAAQLQPLLEEGLYRVDQAFTCCEKDCRTFPADTLVQLGYDGRATPILFLPRWSPDGLILPETGQRVDTLRLSRLTRLLVSEGERGDRHGYH